jgi:hypothetical protein
MKENIGGAASVHTIAMILIFLLLYTLTTAIDAVLYKVSLFQAAQLILDIKIGMGKHYVFGAAFIGLVSAAVMDYRTGKQNKQKPR